MLDKFEMCERKKWLGVEKREENRKRKRGAEEEECRKDTSKLWLTC